MRSSFDRRVVPETALAVVRACQRRVPCRLAGGAALSGAYLAHRLSADIDLFCREAEDVRRLCRELGDVARETGAGIEVVRDAGSFVRARILPGPDPEPAGFAIDLVHEPAAQIEPPPPPLEGVVVESLPDLRASKLACRVTRASRALLRVPSVATGPVENDSIASGPTAGLRSSQSPPEGV